MEGASDASMIDGQSDAAAKAEALRLELGGMKFSTLKARAGAAGVVRARACPRSRWWSVPA